MYFVFSTDILFKLLASFLCYFCRDLIVILKLNKLLSILFFLPIFCSVTAQNKGLSMQLNAEYGFETRSIFVNDYQVSSIRSYGINGSVQYYYPLFHSDFSLNAGAGIRTYQLIAKTALSELSGTVVQPTLNVGVNYKVHKKHQIQLGLKTTLNEEISDFTNEMTDLLRYNYSLSYQYHISSKFTGLIGYERIIYPNRNIYRVENPGNVFSIGVQYNFWR